jgi:hypothetical protein
VYNSANKSSYNDTTTQILVIEIAVIVDNSQTKGITALSRHVL